MQLHDTSRARGMDLCGRSRVLCDIGCSGDYVDGQPVVVHRRPGDRNDANASAGPKPRCLLHSDERRVVPYFLWLGGGQWPLEPIDFGVTRPGKHTNSYWKWPFIVNFPIKNGDFP